MACSAKPFTDDGKVDGLLCEYHVFSDHWDERFSDFDEAKRCYARMLRGPHPLDAGSTRGRCARLYVERFADLAGSMNDELLGEDCLRSYGEYPL